MTKFQTWFSRAVLLVATAVLALISRKFIADPVGAAAASSITLGSPLAITNMRASFGAFPLGCAIFLLACLMDAQRRSAGLHLALTVIGTALVVRLFGVIADGTLAASVPVLIAEALLTFLSGTALYFERGRQV